MKRFLAEMCNRINLPLILFCLVILNGVLCIFTFSTGINLYDLHDYIEGVFWADATLRSGSVINPDYVYYYIVPFGSNLIMAPFVAIFGVSFIANQLGMLVYYLIYLAVLFRLSRMLFEENQKQLIFCAVNSLFIYTYVGDNLLHHLLCYGIGSVCFLGELSCLIEINRKKHSIRNLFLLAFFCLWSSSNGPVTAALSSFPVIFSLLLSGYKFKRIFSREKKKIYLTMISAIFIGLAIYTFIDLSALSNHMYEERFTLAKADEVIQHIIHDLHSDYLKDFYFNPPHVSLFSPVGISAVIMLWFSVFVLVISFYLYKENKRSFSISAVDDETIYMLIIANISVIGICIGQYVLFTGAVHRHLFNGILSLFFLIAVGLANLHEKMIPRGFLFLLCCFAALMTFKSAFFTIAYGNEKKSIYCQINNYLTENDLSYGYTVDRNYKVVELLSQGKNKNSVVWYDETKGIFCIGWDRIYKNEQEKPDTIEKFYIINYLFSEEKNPAEDLLEDLCIEKVLFDPVAIYVFDISDWEALFQQT